MEQVEQVFLQISLPPIYPMGTPQLIGNINLEAYVDGLLPTTCGQPLYITSAGFWFDSPNPSFGSKGNVAIGIDPQKIYTKRQIFATEHQPTMGSWLEPQYEKTLVIWESIKGSRQAWERHNPPIAYRSGDALQVAPEVLSGTPPILGGFVFLGYMATDDNTKIDPSIKKLIDVTSIHYATDVGSFTFRNLTSPAPYDFEWVRFHLTHIGGPGQLATIPGLNLLHASVGIQDGSSSNTKDDPVEVTFNWRSGGQFYPGQWAWSDWIPLKGCAGDVPLITATVKVPPGGGFSWPYNGTDGKGCWVCVGDEGGWATKSLPAGAVWQPTRTHVVDMVQVR